MNKILKSALGKLADPGNKGWRTTGPPLTDNEEREFRKFQKGRADSQRSKRQRRVHDRLNIIDELEDRGAIVLDHDLSGL